MVKSAKVSAEYHCQGEYSKVLHEFSGSDLEKIETFTIYDHAHITVAVVVI